MKTNFVFSLILLLSCCESNGLTEPQGIVGSNINGTVQQSVLVRDGADLVAPFYVKTDSINDSRCPSDVECIWQGIGSAVFSVAGTEFKLLIGKSAVFQVNTVHFQITLVDLQPYPSTQNTGAEKKAVYLITHY